PGGSRGSDQGRATTRARAEEADLQVRLLSSEPVRGADEAVGEQLDIKSKMRRAGIDQFFVMRKQIDEQRPQAALAQSLGDVAIARAETAAAAAVCEQHQAGRAARHDQIAFEP